MRCYYRNDLSCGANIMEFKDQIVIKGKLDQIGIRPIKVSHFGDFRRIFREKRKEERKEEKKEKKKKKKRKKAKKGKDLYGLLWFCMDYYGFLDFCRDISLFHF